MIWGFPAAALGLLLVSGGQLRDRRGARLCGVTLLAFALWDFSAVSWRSPDGGGALRFAPCVGARQIVLVPRPLTRARRAALARRLARQRALVVMRARGSPGQLDRHARALDAAGHDVGRQVAVGDGALEGPGLAPGRERRRQRGELALVIRLAGGTRVAAAVRLGAVVGHRAVVGRRAAKLAGGLHGAGFGRARGGLVAAGQTGGDEEKHHRATGPHAPG